MQKIFFLHLKMPTYAFTYNLFTKPQSWQDFPIKQVGIMYWFCYQELGLHRGEGPWDLLLWIHISNPASSQASVRIHGQGLVTSRAWWMSLLFQCIAQSLYLSSTEVKCGLLYIALFCGHSSISLGGAHIFTLFILRNRLKTWCWGFGELLS